MPSPSSDELESCLNLQSEEWEVLESIYPDYISGDRSKECVRLEIPVEPPESIVVPAANTLAIFIAFMAF
ncbi:hypothetical protein NLI96_g8466 [Meripilus lineatus]|uniref:Uncharacterized protein n=1 Tax=Meripilus lineatus TaxID=2056292 RepID=A0AAD5UXA5_9APHY|nr:hypothetical protein NLI96_g8466 [Physisporinus lineatus]